MIGIDTNVFLRFLVTEDDPRQREAVRRFMAERSEDDPVRISVVVLAETVWVLRSCFAYSPEQIGAAMRQLLCARDIVFEASDLVAELFNGDAAPRADLADYLIAWSNRQAGCASTVTFDRIAAQAVPGMKLLPVTQSGS